MLILKVRYRGIIRTLNYEIVCVDSEFGCKNITKFYEGIETITKRKYWLFGPKITKEQPKHIFDLYLDITSPNYTKREIKLKLFKKLELLNRVSEIERGEII
jgi:hypothetical protein